MKKRCVVLGATGLIGQQFIRLLENHPNFELSNVYASSNSSTKTMKEIWNLPNFDLPSDFNQLQIEDMADIENNDDFDIAFSGLPANIALDLELALREKGVGVFTNASAHRMDREVPILIPEINQKQVELVKFQKEKYNTAGFIISNANCSVTGAAMYLHELSELINIDHSVISTYQAKSGAGYKGLSNQNYINNVFPFIKDEEEKISEEANKILGTYSIGGFIEPRNHPIVANCARVNVTDGHLESVTTFSNDIKISQEDLIQGFKSIKSPLDSSLHTAPKKHLVYLEEEDRPQPKLDSYHGENNQTSGMSLMVGRLRIINNAISSFILVHNTIRGSAGGAILNAELALQKGYL
jgi:aspartate-semialdehyde dehydrogenase